MPAKLYSRHTIFHAIAHKPHSDTQTPSNSTLFQGTVPDKGGPVPVGRGTVPSVGGSVPIGQGPVPGGGGSVTGGGGSVPDKVPRWRGSVPDKVKIKGLIMVQQRL